MNSNYELRNRQFTSALVAVLTVDGSDVTADFAPTGLDNGLHVAKIKKAGAVFTIQLNKALGMTPQVFIQPHTLDCVVRPTNVSSWTKREIELTAYSLAGGAGSGNEDFTVWVFGTEGIVEGGR